MNESVHNQSNNSLLSERKETHSINLRSPAMHQANLLQWAKLSCIFHIIQSLHWEKIAADLHD